MCTHSDRVLYVVCSALLGKELHRQVDMGSVVKLGSLGAEIVSTLTWNARDVGLIPNLGAVFPIFITFMELLP